MIGMMDLGIRGWEEGECEWGRKENRRQEGCRSRRVL